MRIAHSTLAVLTALLATACNQPVTDATKQLPAPSKAMVAPLAPMPGAIPFKQGKPEVPDPVMLQKQIDAARKKSGN